jgi:oligoendopeptidase F
MNKLYANEWSFIPHFYYNFYVYQYATSFISSVIIATKILNGDKDQLEKYLELLKSGGSDYPVELLKEAGVDLTNDDTYKIAFDNFSKYLSELKNLIRN